MGISEEGNGVRSRRGDFSIVLSDPFSGSDRDYRRPVQWDVTLDRAKKCTRPIDLFIVEHARAPRATLLFRVF